MENETENTNFNIVNVICRELAYNDIDIIIGATVGAIIAILYGMLHVKMYYVFGIEHCLISFLYFLLGLAITFGIGFSACLAITWWIKEKSKSKHT